MSDKLKLNFTPIPNVILDEIMRKLAPGATKVLFAICRYTQLVRTDITSDPAIAAEFSQIVRVVIEEFVEEEDFVNVCVITG